MSEPLAPGFDPVSYEEWLEKATDGDASVEVSTAGDLTAICSTARPAKAGTRTRPDESLLVRLTPRARGDVELRGLRVRYTRDARHLWQTGTQLVPVAVRVITP